MSMNILNSSISEITSDYKDLAQKELDLRKFELTELKKIKTVIDSDKWKEVDFIMSLKNPKDWGISKYNFNDCIDTEIILAIKKLVKIGFERAIKNREEIICKLEGLLK